MRILMVAHQFPRALGDPAGAPIWRLAEGLVHRGHSAAVIAPGDRSDPALERLGGVDVFRVRYAWATRQSVGSAGPELQSAPRRLLSLRNWTLVRAMQRAVAARCGAGEVHLVHAHGWFPGGLAARLANRRGRPLIITLHRADAAVARGLPGGRRLMASVLRRAATVTAVSSHLAAEAARALSVAREKIPLTPMPLALGRTADPDTPRAGAIFVGELTRQKGVHHLLEALGILRKQGMSPELTVVGDGPERPALKAQAIALGLRVAFTGYVGPERVADYLQDRRVLVLPATGDGLGLVVAEALTQGVPVVGTRTGGIPDLLTDPEAGLLVPPGDPKALAQAIRQVMSDDRFCGGALRAGRILADRLSPERVAERFESIYSQARGSRFSVAGVRA